MNDRVKIPTCTFNLYFTLSSHFQYFVFSKFYIYFLKYYEFMILLH